MALHSPAHSKIRDVKAKSIWDSYSRLAFIGSDIFMVSSKNLLYCTCFFSYLVEAMLRAGINYGLNASLLGVLPRHSPRSRIGATKAEDDQWNCSIKPKRSQHGMTFSLVLLKQIRPVSYGIGPCHVRWLIGDEDNEVGAYYY